MNTGTLKSLLERVEAATGPGREIDVEIYHAFFPEKKPKPGPPVEGLPDDFGKDELSMSMHPAPFYTASLDAAIGLVERVLPGWIWDVSSTGTAWVMGNDDVADHWSTEKSMESPPLALLAALLRALISKHKDSEE